MNRTNSGFQPIFIKNLAGSPTGHNLKMTNLQGEGRLAPAKPEDATSVRLNSFGGFVFLFTDVTLSVQSAIRFFRTSSGADCVTFVAGLTPTKDDDAASADFGRWQAYCSLYTVGNVSRETFFFSTSPIQFIVGLSQISNKTL